MDQPIATVKLSRLEKVIDSVKLHSKEGIDTDVGFEFLMNSLFPELMKNLENNMHNEYMRGFQEALALMREETDGQVH